ncbi:hypothetical protein BGZ72_005993 [Mortierella alpina]|nr:hypothetical protein BGZ72_005993 [Mortierella alpina]
MPIDMDPIRAWVSNFGSGLEQLWHALQYQHSSKTRKAVFWLSIRCLVLQTILNIIVAIAPKGFCSSYRQLFYPTILLYRYLKPSAWDQLFMGTVQSLGCSGRTDIVAKPNPRYFVQLSRYVRRTFKASLAIAAIHWLLRRSGIFYLPSVALCLAAVHHFMRFKGVERSLLKLLVAATFLGLQWPVWAAQTFILQQLFMYELLQPYLSRVNFKGWEERAWLSQHEVELHGFAFGAWLICSIPWIGVAAIPHMFLAASFLLTRSCGFMENSGIAGDVIERRSPGVKAVADGNSKSVQGNWEAIKIITYVRADSVPAVEIPVSHDNSNSESYSIEKGSQVPATAEQIRTDRELCQARKRDLLGEVDRQMRGSFPGGQRHPQHQGWDARVAPGLFTSSQLHTESGPSAASSSSYPAMGVSTGLAEFDPQRTGTNSAYRIATAEDYRKYNFSDRKTLQTAPSAPPEDSSQWLDSATGTGTFFRVDSAVESPVSAEHDHKKGYRKKRRDQAHDEHRRTKEQKRAAKESARVAKEMRRTQLQDDASASGTRYPSSSETTESWRRAQEYLGGAVEEDGIYTEDGDEQGGKRFDSDEYSKRSGYGEEDAFHRAWGFGRGPRGMRGWERGGRGHPWGLRGGRGLFWTRGKGSLRDGMHQRTGRVDDRSTGSRRRGDEARQLASSSGRSFKNDSADAALNLTEIISRNVHHIERQLTQQIDGLGRRLAGLAKSTNL